MRRFLALRLLSSIAILWAVFTLTFVTTLKLGDPVTIIAGPRANAHDRANVRRFYGLDKPPLVQYGLYLSHMLHGDLGFSFRYRRPVATLIGERFPRTFLLLTISIAMEVVFGVGFGLVAAARRGTRTDTGVMAVAAVAMSMPTFLSGKLFLMAFGYYLGWFPMGGYGDGFVDHLRHAILPAFTLSIISIAGYARLTRNELVDILQADYIRTARAKGLSNASVVMKHALRNALLPVVTTLGLSFGSLFTGAIVTEAIYAWPGLGRLAFESITGLDVPVIVGTVIFGSFGILLGNLLSDLAYAVLDPRIRRG